MSSASTSSQAKCCLCGAPSHLRCPKCAQAGFDIYFCNAEHQKLLWPAHRRVCGSKSNPFLWPKLSDEDAEELIESMYKTTHRVMEGPLKGTTTSLAHRWRREYNLNGEEVKTVLKSLRKNNETSSLVPAGKEQELIFFCRSLLYLLWGVKSREQNPGGFLDLLAGKSEVPEADVFSQQASYIHMYLPFPEYNAEKNKWWTGLMHRWLAVSFISSELPQVPTRNPSDHIKGLFRCGKWIAEDGVRYIKREIQPREPIAARGPLKEFNQWASEYQRAPWE